MFSTNYVHALGNRQCLDPARENGHNEIPSSPASPFNPGLTGRPGHNVSTRRVINSQSIRLESFTSAACLAFEPAVVIPSSYDVSVATACARVTTYIQQQHDACTATNLTAAIFRGASRLHIRPCRTSCSLRLIVTGS